MDLLRAVQKVEHYWHRFLFAVLWTNRFKRLGKNVAMRFPVRIDGTHNVSIANGSFFQRGLWIYAEGIEGIAAEMTVGENCVFGYNNHITCVRSVHIGNNVLTANNVYISDNLHGYEDVTTPIIKQPVRFKRAVTIGDGSWLGENVCIIGVHIGKNCVIGANAVVTHDIPDYSVAVGNPARVIRRYDLEKQKWISL